MANEKECEITLEVWKKVYIYQKQWLYHNLLYGGGCYRSQIN